jgi:pyruvate/2-oxoglutarate dehydrogenase complex dihydrolipoamide acyltransferase (E2) component
MRFVRVGAPVLALLLLMSDPISAQEPAHVLGPEELDSAVIGHAEAADRERERIRALLGTPEVRDVARDHGIDLGRIEAGVGTLGPAGLQRLAPHARAVDRSPASPSPVRRPPTGICISLRRARGRTAWLRLRSPP